MNVKLGELSRPVNFHETIVIANQPKFTFCVSCIMVVYRYATKSRNVLEIFKFITKLFKFALFSQDLGLLLYQK